MKFLALVAALGCGVALAAADKPLVEGNPASPVRVIIYEDLQCPDCADFRAMLDEHLLPQFQDKVAFDHRDFPLAKHSWARKAAVAARFFQTVDPKTAIEFRRTTLRNRRSITPQNFNEKLAAFAREHGVDPAKAVAALDDKALGALVEGDLQDGVARGIAHTPTVLVEGEPFIERFPLEDLTRSIEKALAARPRP